MHLSSFATDVADIGATAADATAAAANAIPTAVAVLAFACACSLPFAHPSGLVVASLAPGSLLTLILNFTLIWPRTTSGSMAPP